MNLALIKDDGFSPENSSLEESLIELSRYGEPNLFKMKKGWLVNLEVFVTGCGVKFDVKSNSDCATPHTAVCQCYSRLVAAIKLIKET